MLDFLRNHLAEAASLAALVLAALGYKVASNVAKGVEAVGIAIKPAKPGKSSSALSGSGSRAETVPALWPELPQPKQPPSSGTSSSSSGKK